MSVHDRSGFAHRWGHDFGLIVREDPLDNLKLQIKELIIDRLRLEGMSPDDIQDDAPLFGEGLGLDSIDSLELVLGIEQKFGVKIQDEELGQKVLASVDALAAFVASKGQGA